jgi:phosphate transport system permease protein
MSVRPKVQPWAAGAFGLRIQTLISIVIPVLITALLVLSSKLDISLAVIACYFPLQILTAAVVGWRNFKRRGVKDSILLVVASFLSILVLGLLFSVLFSVIGKGFETLTPHFVYQNNIYVDNNTPLEYGGVGHAILGTLLIVLLTTVVAVPLGIAMAIYLTTSRAKHLGLVRTITQALSGLPSVVSGLFILAFMSVAGLERSGLTGAMALFPLMLPTVARVAEESLKLVPSDLRQAALALGAPNYRAFFQVVLPAAKSGIVTAVLLGLARVVGETAPLILTTNANNGTNVNVFAGGIASLPTYVYGYLGSGYVTSQARAWGGALVLLILVGVLFGLARIFSRTKSTKSKSKKVK